MRFLFSLLVGCSLLVAGCGQTTGGAGALPEQDVADAASVGQDGSSADVAPDLQSLADTLGADAADTASDGVAVDQQGAGDAGQFDVGADAADSVGAPDAGDAAPLDDTAIDVGADGQADSDAWASDNWSPDANAAEDVGTDAAEDIGVDGASADGAWSDSFVDTDASWEDSWFDEQSDLASPEIIATQDVVWNPDVDAGSGDADADDLFIVDVAEDVGTEDGGLQTDVGPDADVASDDQSDAAAPSSDMWANCPAGQLAELYESPEWIQALRLYNGKLYWSSFLPEFMNKSYVRAMPVAGLPPGGNPTTLINGNLTEQSSMFQGLDVDAGGVYVATNGLKASILTAPLGADGTLPASVLVKTEVPNSGVMGASQPRELLVHAGQIYFRDDEFGSTIKPGIHIVSTAGGAVSAAPGLPSTAGFPLVNGLGLLSLAQPDAGAGIQGGVYFLANGSNVATLLSGGTDWRGMDIDDQNAYWAQVGGGADGLWQAPLAGGMAKQIAQASNVGAVMQDSAAGFIYFYAWKPDGPFVIHGLFKAPLAGGAIQGVACGLPGAVANLRGDATHLYLHYANGKGLNYALAGNAIGSIPK